MPVEPTVPNVLRVAGALVALEALIIVAVGCWMLFGTITNPPKGLAIALSATLFLIIGGLLVGLLSYGLIHGRRWSRAPVVLTQLLLVPIGWSFRAVSAPLAVAQVAVAVGVLVLVFLPSSTAVLTQSSSSRSRS